MSKSKKSVIIIISAICAALIIALGICVGQFYSSTTASVEEYCKENSFKGAESFDINKSSELDGYVLCVSKDGDDSKGHNINLLPLLKTTNGLRINMLPVSLKRVLI